MTTARERNGDVTPAELRAALRENRLLAIVRARDRRGALAAVRTLADEGVRLVEVSLTTPDAVAVIAQAVIEVGDHAVVGAGTVLTARHVEQVLDAGARFVVSPANCAAVTHARELDVPTLGGALTPTEVLAMDALGAVVKVFPMRSAGGVDYLRALRAPFPDIDLVPVGGVTLDDAPALIDAGALAVGVGSPLLGNAGDREDLDGLRRRARTLIDTLKRVTG
jgi:2-dehydro-3-deoxyphosphogluconate aldolase/(4S)-4-hydroxy-2-oxoglutarate aldolase